MNLKPCFKCGVPQPIDNFYPHPKMGRLNKCKECAKKDSRAHRMKTIDKCRAYDSARDADPKRLADRKASAKRYFDNHPGRRAVKHMVWRYVKAGKLAKGPCEVCGAEKTQAHHDDYNKPLSVRWLCSPHHTEWHRRTANA